MISTIINSLSILTSEQLNQFYMFFVSQLNEKRAAAAQESTARAAQSETITTPADQQTFIQMNIAYLDEYCILILKSEIEKIKRNNVDSDETGGKDD